MNRIVMLMLVMIGMSISLFAQHERHEMPAGKKPPENDTSGNMHRHHRGHNRNIDTGMHPGKIPMSHSFSLNLPMNRNGSGTGWLPDASPMYGYMIHSGKWMHMVHGSIFLRYDNQNFNNDDKRGDSRFDAPTWFMVMGQRKVGEKGLFHYSSMFSFDPVIEGGKGYPLLFQTGESYEGKPLVDRQHPHDLFSELSVSYAHAFTRDIDAFVYVGYPGEPALGPVTFMHRPSALDNPNSPISHHWVDATHITFGVVTAGVRVGKFKLEGSSFTGREPDEERYGFDKPRFDSWSGRFSFNPTMNWALQVSHGYLKSPEELHPGENINKTTASAIYSVDMGNENRLNATVLWGMNKQKEHDGENAFMAEGAWRLSKAAIYTRYEFTEKSAEELVLGPEIEEHQVFGVHAFTLGANYDLFEIYKTRLAIGGQWSWYGAPQALNTIYGNNPMAVQVYLRIYPALMKMNMNMK
ncbi:hypothetical protein [Niastella populi]|uniref:Alginate export domain-containing protein n=1 Tax=Niastella populi TaxID=550983 RepID=A0A1V9FL69_9BACT|nr:hypothetical protein [Niastella populi]OQP59037.1 hypothetical protein A4R26_21860 [Niastella populi]